MIAVSNTLEELRRMADGLGIGDSVKGTKRDGSRSRDDYVRAIRAHNWKTLHGGTPPLREELLSHIDSLMLGRRLDSLPKDCQEEVWGCEDWVLEPKVNGLRCCLLKANGSLGVFAREFDEETLYPLDFTESLQGCLGANALLKEQVPDDFIIDCELAIEDTDACLMLQSWGIPTHNATEALERLFVEMSPTDVQNILTTAHAKPTFWTFDCLWHNGEWQLNKGLLDRRELALKAAGELSGIGMDVRALPQWHGPEKDKRGFYSYCVSRGCEGCMAKNVNSTYTANTSRRKGGWVKVKRAGHGDFGDTLDCFITGYDPQDGVQLSVNVETPNGTERRVLHGVPHLSPSMESMVIEDVRGYRALKPLCYNQVVETDYACSTILRFRHDKKASECTMSEELFQLASTQ